MGSESTEPRGPRESAPPKTTAETAANSDAADRIKDAAADSSRKTMGPELIPGEKDLAPIESNDPVRGPSTPLFMNGPLHCSHPKAEDDGITHEGKAETILSLELVPLEPVVRPKGKAAEKPTAGFSEYTLNEVFIRATPFESDHVKELPSKFPIESEPDHVVIGPASFRLPSPDDNHFPS